MRRGLAAVVAMVAVPFAAQPAAAASWAQPQIKVVVANGLMGPSVSNFRARQNITREELGAALAGLTGEQQVVVDPDAEVSIAELNAKIVKALGLHSAAKTFRRKVKEAGLEPPRRLGNEVVARLIWLRLNHPQPDDNLELRPQDPATRAEAAYSLARALQISQWDKDNVVSLAGSFSLPSYSDWPKRVLRRAVHFIGYPYVWGGTSENQQVTFGVTSRGGFDCSGFVWRVYKLTPYAGEGTLASALRGRTTYQMSGEVPRSDRVTAAKLQPGDVMFFGANGPKSKPSVVGHTAIYLGNGWFVQSSGEGVTLLPFDGWYTRTFAWARRPLREAGLSG